MILADVWSIEKILTQETDVRKSRCDLTGILSSKDREPYSFETRVAFFDSWESNVVYEIE